MKLSQQDEKKTATCRFSQNKSTLFIDTSAKKTTNNKRGTIMTLLYRLVKISNNKKQFYSMKSPKIIS